MPRPPQEPRRLQLQVFITKYPGSTFHTEVALRKDLSSLEGTLSGDMSPTRFAFWVDNLMLDQVQALLRPAILEQWGDELARLPGLSDDAPRDATGSPLD